MGEGLKIAALGFMVVFLALICIWLVLEIMRKIFEGKKSSDKAIVVNSEPVVETTPVREQNDNQLIAVLAAAIAATLNTETYNIRIKSYKRISKSL